MRPPKHDLDSVPRIQIAAPPRMASLKLEFVVVGGSLRGLAVAYSLARAGHSVHVIEQRPGLVKVRQQVLFGVGILLTAPCYLSSFTGSMWDKDSAQSCTRAGSMGPGIQG